MKHATWSDVEPATQPLYDLGMVDLRVTARWPLRGIEARGRYLAPTVALSAAGAMLALSLFLPYWQMTLVTPAHPEGLRLVSYLGHLDGPLQIVLASTGAPSAVPLQELFQLERSLAVAMVTVISLLVVAATFVHNRWAALLSLPALCFPVIVIADTIRWLHPIVSAVAATSGSSAANSGVPLFGRMSIAQALLQTRPGAGLILAATASLAVLIGLWLHRAAYKPHAQMPRRGRHLSAGGYDRVS